jgi:outer membrane immunogenic protein
LATVALLRWMSSERLTPVQNKYAPVIYRGFKLGSVMKQSVLRSVALATLLVTPAMAADLPLKTPAPPAPVFSWTGFYIGLEGGAGLGTTENSATAFQVCRAGVCGPVIPFLPAGAARSSYGLSGWHGGGTAGYNWQTGPVVLGVEGDFSGANIQGSSDCALGFDFNLSTGHLPAGAPRNWLGSERRRLARA